jgi:protein TonB
MTAVELYRPIDGEERHHVHGWALSLLCHALAYVCAFAVMAEIDRPVLPNAFHWDVAVVTSQTPVEALPPDMPPVQRAVQPPRQHRPVTTDRQMIEQSTENVTTVAATVSPVQRTIQEVVEVASNADPVIEHQLSEQSAQVVPTKAVTSMREPVVAQAVTALNNDPVTRQAEPVIAQSLVTQEAPQSYEEVVDRPVGRPGQVSAIERPTVQQRLVKYRRTETDYGWLSETLQTRIEQLKRYPPDAKLNHWEGKVVIQALIRDDGMIIDLQVVESSGRIVLDQEALSVMRKLSPLPLKHPLGASRVPILVPISYRLDN